MTVKQKIKVLQQERKMKIKSESKKSEKNSEGGKLNNLRKKIQNTHLILIIAITLLMSVGGSAINMSSNKKNFEQELQDTSILIRRLYAFTKNYLPEDLCNYMDKIVEDLPNLDVISIVDKDLNRIYHTNHSLINTKYDGNVPDFSKQNQKNAENFFYTENAIGPSGPQKRTYSLLFDENGNYDGFILTIKLQTSIMAASFRTMALFFVVTVLAILIEIIVSSSLFKIIKKEFLTFTEDFEGTKFLVDSMRANNHDFTNKLHVILGLIQIGEYEKACSYIENISIIQRETVSNVMNSIENPSFAALIIGKIARASECNVKFILQEGSFFKAADLDLPSEALVTITGNLIDNALDSMNMSEINLNKQNELNFGVFTKKGELLIIVKDNGNGIPPENLNKIFENGFSTKGDGRGVGLFHTKQLVESLGGTISVESQIGKGACFMVSFKKKD